MEPGAQQPPSAAKGRGSALRPANRFEATHLIDDWEHFEGVGEEVRPGALGAETTYLADDTQSIVSENHSPDIPFRYSLNPYRGCLHGCSYCYARPTHEYLGYNAGLDFETKIFFKPQAARLFREFLCRDRWQPELIMLSGVTDCYQPIERKLQLTRACLEVAVEARQPMSIITKNALVLRDLPLLVELARYQAVSVAISVTTLDPELAATMEPRTSVPAARLRAIRELSAAGIPTQVMVAPVIPGLNDHELASVLSAAYDAGARRAGYVLLRLPLTVAPVFLEWLERTQPLRAERVRERIRATREGELNQAQFGARMRGTGVLAAQIQQSFQIFAKKIGFEKPAAPLDSSHFRPPRSPDGQLRLFD